MRSVQMWLSESGVVEDIVGNVGVWKYQYFCFCDPANIGTWALWNVESCRFVNLTA